LVGRFDLFSRAGRKSDQPLPSPLVTDVPGLLALFGGMRWLRRPLCPRLVSPSMIPAIVLFGAFYTPAIHL